MGRRLEEQEEGNERKLGLACKISLLLKTGSRINYFRFFVIHLYQAQLFSPRAQATAVKEVKGMKGFKHRERCSTTLSLGCISLKETSVVVLFP